ncbi:ATP-binding protein [Nocardioides sp. SOB77]|uniref:ATP-binding protein n=1 Tax=Nocardioides oceani TaxID=3058369 RepID=A0ABT8FME5_9ACTN|nr:ATP-binding protein [Nocardioides oceani]MDN4175676.1 ATP-binding protein [Nocardioides oceani]
MASAKLARRALTAELKSAGSTRQQIEDVALVLTEMVHNAVAHGRPLSRDVLEVEWSLDPTLLRVTVRDGGHAGALQPLPPTDTAPGGRGLLMIDGLASRWSVGLSDTTVVTAEFDIRL